MNDDIGSPAIANDRARREPEEADSGRRMDPEIRLLGSFLRQLDELDPAARRRIVTYLNSRYSCILDNRD